MAAYHKKFVALDLETTHLDMREGRIMEVGVVEVELFFDEQKKLVKTKFGKEFSSLINPEIPPSPRALELTGITQGELDKAPAWKDVKPGLQKFLHEKVLVGHNLGFDLDYLKNQGLALKNEYFDTLEITQTLLPLRPIHSLEYLAGEFAVSSSPSHRALEDSKNSSSVLAETLNEFLRFDLDLQKEIKNLLERFPVSFRGLVLDLPEVKAKDHGDEGRSAISTPPPSSSYHGKEFSFDWPDKTILTLPLGFAKQENLLRSQASGGGPSLVAVSHPVFLDAFPPEQVIVSPGMALCEKRFSRLKNEEKLPPVVARIILKILIFRAKSRGLDLSEIKWAGEEKLILDLFTVDPEVCPHHECEYWQSLKLRPNQTHALTLATLFALTESWAWNFAKQKILLVDLAKIEDEFAESQTRTSSLRQVRRVLRRIYPLEDAGTLFDRLPRAVEVLANELDLFFGIMHLVYRKREDEYTQTILVDEREQGEERFQKLLHPAEKLISKLGTLNEFLQTQVSLSSQEAKIELTGLLRSIQKLSVFLKEFFLAPRADETAWLKFDAEEVILGLVPNQLAAAWKKFAQQVKSLTILDTVLPTTSLSYFRRRLGLDEYALQSLSAIPDELALRKKIKVQIFSKVLDKMALVNFFLSLPDRALVVLPNETKLAEYYEQLKKSETLEKPIFAYRLSGKWHQMSGRLETEPRWLFLLTTNALMRFFPTLPRAEHLVVLRLPFEAPGKVLGSFMDQVLPRAVHLLHKLLTKFCATQGEDKQVWLLDERILTDYDQAFYKYLQEFSDYQISTIDKP